MENVNNEKFAEFILELRKEKALTQKQLAEQIGISDKAVSKWERGLSLPDITLLIPLSEVLGVTTTELLSGRRLEDNVISIEEAENLVIETINLSKTSYEIDFISLGYRKNIFIFAIIVCALELVVLFLLGYTISELSSKLAVFIPLVLVGGAYFTFFVKDELPVYYDENKIRVYHQDYIRLSVGNLKFNNSNWKYIIKTMQMSLCCILVFYPLYYFIISWFYPEYWEVAELIGIILYMSGIFIPSYIIGKKYE